MALTTPPSPPSLSALLSEGKPIIIDGALATYLETLGADITGALWSADILAKQPDLITRTHLDYFHAGAQIAITASYQASVPGLTKHLNLSSADAAALIKKSVDLAAEAREKYVSSLPVEQREERRGRLLIAGSVGPYGAFLADGSEYRGDYVVSKEEMKAFHRGRINALVNAGVDVLALETIPQIEEARALVELLQEEFPDTQAWMSFTLRDKSHISDGTKFSDVLPLLEDVRQIVSVGFNCIPDELTLPALRELQGLTKMPVVVYPNSGEVWNAEKRDWEGQRVEGGELADRVKDWWNADARLIGGCCRTGPKDIGVIEKALRGFTARE